MKELSPKEGWEFFTQPSEIAKFIAYWFMGAHAALHARRRRTGDGVRRQARTS
jgi:hypothetical protein